MVRVVSWRRIARERGWALTRHENARASPLCRMWILAGIQIGRSSCPIGRHRGGGRRVANGNPLAYSRVYEA